VPQPRKRPGREEEWQTVLRRALDLPGRDQHKLYHALTDLLAGALWRESERARQVRLRHEALEAMRAAATHLELPADQPPTVTRSTSAPPARPRCR